MSDQVIPSSAEFQLHCTSDSCAQTVALGAAVAGLLQGGEVVLLYGALGAGKTSFVQGVCQGLGIGGDVVSPTFTLVNTYPGSPTVHHLDFYRVDDAADLNDIGVPDILDDVWRERAVILAEWPAPLMGELGPDEKVFELLSVAGSTSDQRVWYLRDHDRLPDAWRDLFNDGDGLEESSC